MYLTDGSRTDLGFQSAPHPNLWTHCETSVDRGIDRTASECVGTPVHRGTNKVTDIPWRGGDTSHDSNHNNDGQPMNSQERIQT